MNAFPFLFNTFVFMKVLLTGANGGVGTVVCQAALHTEGIELVPCSRQALDVLDSRALAKALLSHKPDYVINAAAFTHVDRAETEVEEAFRLNALCLKGMVDACNQVGAALIHLSTDYVFDGEKKTPYTEEDKENPINMYGASKWAGEQVVLAYNLGTVVRTSWVYSLHSKNFLAAIPRLLRTKDEPLYVENSQKNSPTFAPHLVEALLALVKKNVRQGLYHYTNAGGGCTRYEFACHVRDRILEKEPGARLVPVYPMEPVLQDPPGTAPRPLYSVMSPDKIAKQLGLTVPHWQEGIGFII